MNRFSISPEPCPVGFHEHISLNPTAGAALQMNRRRLLHRSGYDKGNVSEIKKIIEQNASLRIGFCWSFETMSHLKEIIIEGLEQIAPKYNEHTGNLITDMRCDWIGFVPFNIFDKAILDDMSIYSLIIFNNELVDFQVELIDFILKHPCYRHHAFLHDRDYRYGMLKAIRHDPVALAEAYIYYMDAVVAVNGLRSIPTLFPEETIGCHYLHHPEVFFELTEFYILKGMLYNE
jgi:hypothetical protein